MSEGILSSLAKLFANQGNTDHPDLEAVDSIALSKGADQLTGRKAFFAARDIRSLKESELLDGGDGSETENVDIEQLAEDTLRK
ncbi:MAG: hypothetical protein WA152_02330 [Microgenomates group bacterium]